MLKSMENALLQRNVLYLWFGRGILSTVVDTIVQILEKHKHIPLNGENIYEAESHPANGCYAGHYNKKSPAMISG